MKIQKEKLKVGLTVKAGLPVNKCMHNEVSGKIIEIVDGIISIEHKMPDNTNGISKFRSVDVLEIL